MQLCWTTASGSSWRFRGPPGGRCSWHAPLPEVAPSSGEGAPAAGNSHEFIPTCSAPTFLTFFLQSGIRDHSRFPVSTAAVVHSWVCLLNGPWLLRTGRNTEASSVSGRPLWVNLVIKTYKKDELLLKTEKKIWNVAQGITKTTCGCELVDASSAPEAENLVQVSPLQADGETAAWLLPKGCIYLLDSHNMPELSGKCDM